MSQTPTNMPIIAASYERVSTRAQGQYGFSLGAQHESSAAFTAAQGWMLPDEYRFRDGVDEDASGKDWDLPGLTAMLDAARCGAFSVLVVPHPDRFARNRAKAAVLKEQLKGYGIRVVYIALPVADTPEGRLQENILDDFAEYERERICLRTTIGRRKKAKEGMVVGAGRPPYGYRFTYVTLPHGKRRVVGLELDPATVDVARRILTDLRTRSTLDVADALNREGIPACRAKRWSAASILCIAQNPVYCGRWVYARHERRATPDQGGGIAVEVPSLIDRAEWEALQQALARRVFIRRGRSDDDPYVLRGMLSCGHSHAPLRTMTSQGYRYYACGCFRPSDARRHGKPVCDLPAVYALDLEAELWRVLSATLLDPAVLRFELDAAQTRHASQDQLRQDRLNALDTQIAKQRRGLDVVVQGLADTGAGEVYAAILRQAKTLEDMIGKLTAERAQLAAVVPTGLSPEDAEGLAEFAATIADGLWEAEPAERRRLYELLQVRGTVSVDPDGVRLGQRHHYRIDWQAVIPLRSSDKSLLKHLLLLRSDGAVGGGFRLATLAA